MTFPWLLAAAAGLAMMLPAAPRADAAPTNCGHPWAVPGTYTITGNFRGKVEMAGARLTRDCRVVLQIPGVFSGAKVRKAGRCLRFSFKVEGQQRAFNADWCGATGTVPWQGRNIQVSVTRVGR